MKSVDKNFEYIMTIPSTSLTADPLMANTVSIGRRPKGYNTFDKTPQEICQDFTQGKISVLSFDVDDIDELIKELTKIKETLKKRHENL